MSNEDMRAGDSVPISPTPHSERGRCRVIDDEIACMDDLCHGSDTTLCGLERYVDFETDEFDDDLEGFWDDHE